MHRVASVLGSGVLPLWTSGLYSGFPLFADSEAGTLFPLNWLLIVFNDPRGLLTVLCASLCVSALGMYAFARSLGAGPVASAIGAWCWSLGGFATGHLIHVSILNSTAPLPWLLLAVDRVLATGGSARWRWLIAAASLHALQWLGGHVQPELMTWWLVGAYLAFRLFVSPTPGAPARSRLQRLVLFGGVPAFIGTVAFGLSAAQLLPTLELAGASARGAGAAYAYGTTYSVAPVDMLTLFSPFFFQHDSGVRWSLWAGWETAAYAGILPLILAVIGLLPSGRRLVGQVAGAATRERLFFTFIAVVSLWLAMGDSAPLSPYRWVQALPLMNILRAPARFLMLFDFSLAVLAALGAERLLSAANPFERVAARRLAIAVGGITLVLLCIVFGVAGWIGANREATIQWLDSTYGAFPNAGLLHPPERLFDFLQWAVWLGNPRLAFALLVLLAAALWTMSACTGGLQPRRRRLFAVALVLADLSYFAYGFWQPVSVQELAKPDAVVQLVRDEAAGTRVFSWPQAATLPDRLLALGRCRCRRLLVPGDAPPVPACSRAYRLRQPPAGPDERGVDRASAACGKHSGVSRTSGQSTARPASAHALHCAGLAARTAHLCARPHAAGKSSASRICPRTRSPACAGAGGRPAQYHRCAEPPAGYSNPCGHRNGRMGAGASGRARDCPPPAGANRAQFRSERRLQPVLYTAPLCRGRAGGGGGPHCCGAAPGADRSASARREPVPRRIHTTSRHSGHGRAAWYQLVDLSYRTADALRRTGRRLRGALVGSL